MNTAVNLKILIATKEKQERHAKNEKKITLFFINSETYFWHQLEKLWIWSIHVPSLGFSLSTVIRPIFVTWKEALLISESKLPKKNTMAWMSFRKFGKLPATITHKCHWRKLVHNVCVFVASRFLIFVVSFCVGNDNISICFCRMNICYLSS